MKETTTQLEQQLRETSSTQLRDPSYSMRRAVLHHIDVATRTQDPYEEPDQMTTHRVGRWFAIAACVTIVGATALLTMRASPEAQVAGSPALLATLIDSGKQAVADAPTLETLASRAMFEPYKTQGQALIDDAQKIYGVLENSLRPIARVINSSSGSTGAPTGF
ncbi:MAG: hypothetical protein ACF8GE_06410 [Phycisphaerales bacterium JB043]